MDMGLDKPTVQNLKAIANTTGPSHIYYYDYVYYYHYYYYQEYHHSYYKAPRPIRQGQEDGLGRDRRASLGFY